jgi:hypothetical protein
MIRCLIVMLVSFLFVVGCSPSPIEAAGQPNGSSNVTQVSGPSVVDLSKLTPVNNEGGTNVVIPAPQTRNSKNKLIHDISLDVSKRLGVNIDEVTLVDIIEKVWPDESLGCPAAGKVYTQVAVNGYQVIVKANATEYIYNTKGFEAFIWCNDGVPVDAVK